MGGKTTWLQRGNRRETWDVVNAQYLDSGGEYKNKQYNDIQTYTHTHAGISVLFLTSVYVSIITSKTFQFKKSEYCHNLNDESRKYFYHVVNFQTRRVATKARCRAWKRPWANHLHAEFSISQLIITEKPLLYKKKGEGRLHSHSIRSSQEEDRC